MLLAGHTQVISRISKGSQNILIYMYKFIITTFDHQGDSQGGGISAREFALARNGVVPPLHIGLLSNAFVPAPSPTVAF